MRFRTIVVLCVGVLCVVGLAAWAGFWLGRPSYCCNFPGNRDFTDYVAIWSGPVTGILAVFIAFSGYLVRRVERRNRCERMIAAIYIELIETCKATIPAVDNVRANRLPLMDGQGAYVGLVHHRPLAEAFLPNIYELDPTSIQVVATGEARLRSAVELATFKCHLWGQSVESNESTSTVQLRRVDAEIGLQILIASCAIYLAGLTDPSVVPNQENTIALLQQLGIDNPDAYVPSAEALEEHFAAY